MPAKVIDVAQARTMGDLRDVVHRAVQALAEGHLVAFPTETVYGVAAAGLNEKAVDRLLALKGRKAGHPFALAVKGIDDALDYVPNMPMLGERLARRCWPGPITLVFDATHPDSLAHRLPPTVRQAVCPHGTIGLRVPASPLVLDSLRLLAGPLALTSANEPGQPESTTAEGVMATVGDELRLILDDGKCQFGQPSTVVQVLPDRLKILRLGVVSQSNLKRLASLFIVFVCTGNTCRSPMAEALCRRLVGQRLHCSDAEVEDRGVVVASAGIAAMTGGRATQEAVEVLCSRGLNLSEHLSQPLREPLVRNADFIFTMTHNHREAILAQWPDAAPRTFVLDSDGRDVNDPIGGTPEMYENCASQIEALIESRLAEMDLTEVHIET
jgi:protein-tyrosine phosphatase